MGISSAGLPHVNESISSGVTFSSKGSALQLGVLSKGQWLVRSRLTASNARCLFDAPNPYRSLPANLNLQAANLQTSVTLFSEGGHPPNALGGEARGAEGAGITLTQGGRGVGRGGRGEK